MSGDARGGILPGMLSASRTDLASGRQTLTRPTGQTIGFLRPVEGRWFAEDATGLPLEGTFRRRYDAAQAVLDDLEPSS